MLHCPESSMTAIGSTSATLRAITSRQQQAIDAGAGWGWDGSYQDGVGGGIYGDSSESAMITDCVIRNNWHTWACSFVTDGSGIHNASDDWDGDIRLRDTYICNNSGDSDCQIGPSAFSDFNFLGGVWIAETCDTDGDGVFDVDDACPNDPDNDADGDGVCGDVDQCPGQDDSVDTDSDDTPDCNDDCPNESPPVPEKKRGKLRGGVLGKL